MQYVLLFHATVVAGTRLKVMLHVQCLSCFGLPTYATTTHPIEKQKETGNYMNNTSNNFKGNNVYDLWAIK
jgi:hypothetical protein